MANGRGTPLSFVGGRRVPSLTQDMALDANGRIVKPNGVPGSALIRKITLDLTNVFTDQLYDIPGNAIWFNNQSGGTAGTLQVRLDQLTNDTLDLSYKEGITDIGFGRVWITNPTAQPGVSAIVTIIKSQEEAVQPVV